ncbi:hypothetical protein [Blautia sp. 1033sp1_1033st1_G9_1033SCRN_220408]|uniref:hypothetical protein n=1 Tax=Blautia sp. 1033sp1_1033st1_G9_1033SCRN_220408 TaxID=3144490 RepID=UPI0034A40801
MMNELLVEYDDIIIGKRDNFSEMYFNKENRQNSKNALTVIRYSITKYLRWSKEAVSERMTPELMEKLHLQDLMKYVNFPIEYSREKDYFYLANLIFTPQSLSLRDKTIHIYEQIIDGKISKYPKDYFSGSDGYVRAGICLQYMVTHFVSFSSINELYSIFASEEGYSLLKKYKLLTTCRETFETPVDFLHFALPDHQKNNFYYNYYRFKFGREMIAPNGRKQKNQYNYKLEGDLE